MDSRRTALLVALVLLVVACSATEQATPDPAFDGVASRKLPTSPSIGQEVGTLSLPDASDNGAPFFFRAPDKEVLVVYFGFTSCPDVCPTTLADLKAALSGMGASAGNVDVAMVTVDPERDSAETLVDYVQWFIPSAHALRTEDRSMLEEVGDAFGAEFTVVKTSDANVEVLHTAYLYGVDDTGRVVVTWPFGVEPDKITVDITMFLAR
jgi:protein SCO1/2